MRVDLFDFPLPDDCIANRPVVPRDAARLLHVSGDQLSDYIVSELPGLLRSGDLLVFNNTRVMPARLYGQRGAVQAEFLLHKEEKPGVWHALARPAKRLSNGDEVIFADDFKAQVLGRAEDGSVRLRFDCAADDFAKALSQHGHMPLPPYMGRDDDDQDKVDYQTIYASETGAVAAPTAGLHFTEDLLTRLADHGIESATLTLHVGLGTFLPMKVDDTDEHLMHREWAEVTSETAAQITTAKREGRRIVAVGTTSLRTLESAADDNGEVKPFAQETGLFIVPGYRFKAVDVLMTNFHLPRSTLFMLVSAFSGTDQMKAAYAHAVESGYRFYSYGDACLLERATGS